MFSSSDSPTKTTNPNPLSHFFESVLSYDGNVILAAIVTFLLVILFVLLLHGYGKWLLAQTRHRRRSSMSVSHILGPTLLHNFPTFTVDNTLSTSPTKGLDASIISSIPLFVYKSEEHKQHGLECVICLSAFQDEDIGRNLPMCQHAFHVECIDMWLHSHSRCPICRAPVVCDGKVAVANDGNSGEGGGELWEAEVGDLGLVGGESIMETVIDVFENSDSFEENVEQECIRTQDSSIVNCE